MRGSTQIDDPKRINDGSNSFELRISEGNPTNEAFCNRNCKCFRSQFRVYFCSQVYSLVNNKSSRSFFGYGSIFCFEFPSNDKFKELAMGPGQ